MTTRTHPSGRRRDGHHFVGTPEARAIAAKLRLRAKAPNVCAEPFWDDPDHGGVGFSAYYVGRNRHHGWYASLSVDAHNYTCATNALTRSLRTALRTLARRLEGRQVIHAPRRKGYTRPPEAASMWLLAGQSRRLMTVDPHRIPEHRPGRSDHLRDLIARYHRSC
jgi:hypothetical protein